MLYKVVDWICLIQGKKQWRENSSGHGNEFSCSINSMQFWFFHDMYVKHNWTISSDIFKEFSTLKL
jgi:hypothetical protein